MELEVVAIIISIATFAASIVSPILVTIINNHYQAKKQQIEYYDNHKNQVIENYLRSIGQFLYDFDYQKDQNYGSSCAEIYMYVPEKLWDKIDSLDDSIRQIENSNSYEQKQYLRSCAQNEFLELRKAFSDLGRTA